MAGNRRAVRWLTAQLPELVASGTITAESAAAIRSYYEKADTRRANFAFVLLTTVGAVLVGAGIILLVAHNWDELSRATRTVIAFLPLLTAQALIAFVLLRRDESRPWRELVAIFDVATLGAAIALVSQIYQFQGSFDSFILTWMLLSLPIVYLLRTSLGAAIYLIGTVVWVNSHWTFWGRPQSPNLFWLLWLLITPYVVVHYLKARDTRETATLAVVLALAALFGLAPTASYARVNAGAIAYAGAVTLVYLAGMSLFSPRESGRLPALALVGAIGIGITALVLTFENFWRMSSSRWIEHGPSRYVALAIQFAFPIAATAFAGFELFRGRAKFSLPAALFPILTTAAWGLANLCDWNLDRYASNRCSYAAATLMNIYVLWLAIDILSRGIRVVSVARANFGLVLIAGLALCRFFDSDLSFVTRGLGFIAVGAGFLMANVFLFKRRAAAAA